MLGARSNAGVGATGYFNGTMACVRIWSVVRTPTELSQKKNTPILGVTTGLLAEYPMVSDAVTPVDDNVGTKDMTAATAPATPTPTVYDFVLPPTRF